MKPLVSRDAGTAAEAASCTEAKYADTDERYVAASTAVEPSSALILLNDVNRTQEDF